MTIRNNESKEAEMSFNAATLRSVCAIVQKLTIHVTASLSLSPLSLYVCDVYRTFAKNNKITQRLSIWPQPS